MHNMYLKGNKLLRKDDSNTSQTKLSKESSSCLNFELVLFTIRIPAGENGRMNVVMGLQGK